MEERVMKWETINAANVPKRRFKREKMTLIYRLNLKNQMIL